MVRILPGAIVVHELGNSWPFLGLACHEPTRRRSAVERSQSDGIRGCSVFARFSFIARLSEPTIGTICFGSALACVKPRTISCSVWPQVTVRLVFVHANVILIYGSSRSLYQSDLSGHARLGGSRYVSRPWIDLSIPGH